MLGDQLVELDVEHRRDHDRRGDHHDPERALHGDGAPRSPQPIKDPSPAECQCQQHQSGARGVCETHRDGTTAGRADRDHGRKYRAGARRVNEAERRADEEARGEAVATSAGAEAREHRQRALEALRDLRHDQRDAEKQQHDNRHVAQQIVAEPDAVDDLGDADDRDREGRRQAEDDADRPPPATGAAR